MGMDDIIGTVCLAELSPITAITGHLGKRRTLDHQQRALMDGST
jgi:hypothetical protein